MSFSICTNWRRDQIKSYGNCSNKSPGSGSDDLDNTGIPVANRIRKTRRDTEQRNVGWKDSKDERIAEIRRRLRELDARIGKEADIKDATGELSEEREEMRSLLEELHELLRQR